MLQPSFVPRAPDGKQGSGQRERGSNFKFHPLSPATAVRLEVVSGCAKVAKNVQVLKLPFGQPLNLENSHVDNVYSLIYVAL